MRIDPVVPNQKIDFRYIAGRGVENVEKSQAFSERPVFAEIQREDAVPIIVQAEFLAFDFMNEGGLVRGDLLVGIDKRNEFHPV